MFDKYLQYMDDVLHEKIVVGRLVRLAVQRQQDDLKRQTDKNFQYYFNERKAKAALTVLSLLTHTTGDWKGMRFQVQPFQAFRFACIFGWVRKDNEKRRFRRVYCEVARKQGKSEEATAMGIIGLLFDNENTPQIYSAATTREQAKIIFMAAKIMLRQLADMSPAIKQIVKIQREAIYGIKNDGIFKALSSDATTLDGLNPHMALIDEVHEHNDTSVIEVMETGMGARSQPLLYMITTAGFNVEGACYAIRRNCINVLEGKVVDDSLFTVIYTIDEDDDWADESVWIKANPQIGITPSWEYMRSKYTDAANKGGRAQVEFLTKNLNVWTRSHTTWIKDDTWVSLGADFTPEQLRGKRCYAGLDLATTTDICALCLLFPPDEDCEKYRVLFHFWCPKDNAIERSKRDRVDYVKWADDGWLTLTPGNTTDYAYIRNEVMSIAETYQLHSVAYDRYNSSQLVIDLLSDGIRMEKFSQSVINMNAPTVDLEKNLLDGTIEHNDNPVMRWMMGNVAIHRDANGNIKINKAKAIEKVDGAVSMVMAWGQYMTYKVEPSFSSYLEDPDADVLMF